MTTFHPDVAPEFPVVDPKPISGFPEMLPAEHLAERHQLHVIQGTFEMFGFSPIDTPAVERLEVLTAKGGLNRQIYTVGRAGNPDADTGLGLRFDLTVPLARYVAVHASDLVFPFRRYHVAPVWRGERAQKGRYHQFWQADIDTIGDGHLDLLADADTMVVLAATLEAIGLHRFTMQVSNRKILSALMDVYGLTVDQSAAVMNEVDKSRRDGIGVVMDRVAAGGSPSGLTDHLGELAVCDNVTDVAAVLMHAGADTVGVDELHEVLDAATRLGLRAGAAVVDCTIARGLDYYTGTVFETFVTGREEWGSVCSGGRYDNLASAFTRRSFPGVGGSIGHSRLFRLLLENNYITPQASTPTKVLVTVQDPTHRRSYLGLANYLRQENIPTEVWLSNSPLRDQIAYADRKGIPVAVIATPHELDHDVAVVRDLRHHTQTVIPGDTLADHIRRVLHDDLL